ncbi:hypothetical protein GCM10009576_099200 [Streptomyces rhizosphaericus]|uniref:Uncharacterized protein n=1 Tax=Streptomyces rhizosphaericus TaxID=114699 RepID=A0ABN1TBM5_9ACTN
MTWTQPRGVGIASQLCRLLESLGESPPVTSPGTTPFNTSDAKRLDTGPLMPDSFRSETTGSARGHKVT